MLTTVRVQEKGQVTIPRDLRRKLKLRKGDMVTFIETSQGVVIRSLGQAAQELQRTLEEKLSQRGLSLEKLLAASQDLSGDGAAGSFGLSEEEQALFYQVVQLRAQMALESIRNSADASGTAQISDEEIESEIQAVRNRE